MTMANQGRRWFEKRKEFVFKSATAEAAAADTPDLWTKCPACNETVFNETLSDNLMVCPVCDHHFRIGGLPRIEMLADDDTVELHDQELAPVDALGFVDSKPYGSRIKASHAKTGMNDAFVSASATIDGIEVEIGAFDFRYMGGSMGSVVGEAITRLVERAIAHQRPVIIVSASGGARMQEGVLSLMQMAKTSAALARLKDAVGQPYISVLTHPTTGGVAASFAMLGDIILAEPKALIGFAGPRVIKQTIGEDLPDGFQTSEYLLDHGCVDAIVHRRDLRDTLVMMLRQLLRLPARTHEGAEVVPIVVNREVAAGGPALSKPPTEEQELL